MKYSKSVIVVLSILVAVLGICVVVLVGKKNGSDEQGVSRKNISIVFDSKKSEVATEAVLEDDTTYLPVQAVADTLGLYVDCDQGNAQVVFSETPVDHAESKPITFYITRHGETMFNVSHLAQGWCDSPLTENGIAQAKQLGEGLKDIPFVAAYSSTSDRAYETAEAILSGRDLEIQSSKDLREMYYGILEGGTNEELAEIAEEKGLDQSYFLTVGYDVVEGENWDELGERMMGALDEAAKTYAPVGGNILIATHGMSIMAVLQQVSTPEQFQEIMASLMETGGISNCSITKLVWDNGEYTLEAYNDTSYLP